MLALSVGNYSETEWLRLLLALLLLLLRSLLITQSVCVCVGNDITSLERENCSHILTATPLDESPTTLCKASDKYKLSDNYSD